MKKEFLFGLVKVDYIHSWVFEEYEGLDKFEIVLKNSRVLDVLSDFN